MSGLLVGWEPIGGDPDRLYRPIKSELARALQERRLPFWSDRFGLGVPLVAESHVAAFYPPNWPLYRLLDVAAAYRLSMWLHYLALAGATYAYARRLTVSPWGSALAAVAFTLSGFQAIHSSHEPFYSALPFLPLALYFAETYAAGGRLRSLALLALTWGAQLTLGHFQIQLWTALLVLVIGLWRCAGSQARRRVLGLAAALAGAAGIAAVQLVLSWEQARLVGATRRSLDELTFFSYPPAHWPELAIPRMFQGLGGGPEHPYWFAHGTTGYEACLYVGTIPLILACVAVVARRDRALAPWRLIVPVSFALATLPAWWPAAYQALLHVPGLGYFRAPGRYTMITSLGLALLAGRGFDRTLPAHRFTRGLALAVVFAAAASVWALHWAQRPDYRAALGGAGFSRCLALAAIAWISGVAAVLAWRHRLVGPGVPFLIAALELGVLYYHGTTVWGWSIELPQRSPVLMRLAREADVGTVAGPVHDLPVRAGRSPTYPYLGMRAPLPNALLEFATRRLPMEDPAAARLLRRFGAAYGIWEGSAPAAGIDTLYAGADDVLDRLAYRPPGASPHATWTLVRYADPWPAAHVALRAAEAPDLRTLLARLAQSDASDTAWFLPGDRPPASSGPPGRAARIVRWSGLDGEVDHDGPCDLVVRRTYAPGWTARIDDAVEVPVVPVDAGLQAVRLPGSGRTHIALRYRPPRLAPARLISALSLAGALLVLVFRLRSGKGDARDTASTPPRP